MELSEEEKLKTDILFQIDMQLYDEFNDKLCEINEHLGDIYTYKDLQDVKEVEKERERSLLIEAIKKLQYKIEELEEDLDKKVKALDITMSNPDYICKDKIRKKIKDLEKKAFDNEINYSNYHYKTEILKELLEEN